MKNTDILSRINALLFSKVNLAQMTLDNGTVVEAESFEVGSDIFAIDGETKTPLEIGDYTFEDGSKLYVTEIGKIGELASVETEITEEELKNKMEAELEAQELAKKEETNNLILKVVESLKPVFEEMNAKIENLSKVNSEIKETLSKVSAKKPLTHKPTEVKSNFSSVKSMVNVSGTEARIMALLSK
jgi:hypothetical protein